MPRKNHAHRRPQRRRPRADLPPLPAKRPSPPPLEAMVLPKGRCPAMGLLQFAAEDAERALHQAQATRAARGQTFREERAFECESCGYHHLTARKEYS